MLQRRPQTSPKAASSPPPARTLLRSLLPSYVSGSQGTQERSLIKKSWHRSQSRRGEGPDRALDWISLTVRHEQSTLALDPAVL